MMMSLPLLYNIQQLITNCTSSDDSSSHKIASRRLANLQKNVSSVSTATASLSGYSDVCLLCQYKEQLSDFKKELGDICNDGLMSPFERM